MRLRLVLAQRQDRRVPAVSLQAGGVVDRQPEVVAELGTGNAVLLILVVARGPLAREIDLRERRRGDEPQRRDDESGYSVSWRFGERFTGRREVHVCAYHIALD